MSEYVQPVESAENDHRAWLLTPTVYGYSPEWESERYDDHYEGYELEDRKGRRQDLRTVSRLALDNADLDYFEKATSSQPKRAVGEYVAGQGFSVPLIRSNEEWQAALGDGTAMVRTELEQDYNGLQGIYDSYYLPIQDEDARSSEPDLSAQERAERLTEEYLSNGVWQRNKAEYFEAAARLGLPPERLIEAYRLPTVSRWRHLPGLNISVFKDPSVDGRYHFGTRSYDPLRSKSSCWIDAGEYDEHIEGRYFTPIRSLSARQVIEYYEAIRSLPLFDTTNAPLLELQMDVEGGLHFLQYYKTRHAVAVEDPFTLPTRKGGVFESVRGATPQEGLVRRMYIEPQHMTRRMLGQAVCLDFITSKSELQQDMLARAVDIYVTEGDISLRGTHWASSALYAPKLSLSTEYGDATCRQELANLTEWRMRADDGRNVYVNIRVTSNGRSALLESDFNVYYDGFV